ncbi:diacylglycerol kinase family lipid kinase [Nakamurella silvestris]|nr:diacylglycerol kinase family lipid kinase [Nakamurella silvestris]
MRALLIVNPHATSTTSRRRDLLAHALAGEVQLTVANTTERGHAVGLAAEAAADGVDLVVVHAGDGTVNEAVNGLLTRGLCDDAPMLAIVPGGSTNVFARALGIDADPTQATEQILEALQEKRFRRVSLGRADDRYFTFNAGMGLDAAVVAEVEKQRAKGKTISNGMHIREMMKLYLRSDRSHGELTVQLPDGEPVSGCHLAFISNVDPWTYFGNRPVRTNPGTSPTGGLGVFASRTLSPVPVSRVARQLLRRKGDPQHKHLLRADDVSEVTVSSDRPVGFQLDGDYLGERKSVNFSSVPRALRVVV